MPAAGNRFRRKSREPDAQAAEQAGDADDAESIHAGVMVNRQDKYRQQDKANRTQGNELAEVEGVAI